MGPHAQQVHGLRWAAMAPHQPTFLKIGDIKPNSAQINTIVKVLSSEVRLQCLGYQNKRVAEVLVGDDTGTAILRMEHTHARLCSIGGAVVVRGARVEMFGGKIRLELG